MPTMLHADYTLAEIRDVWPRSHHRSGNGASASACRGAFYAMLRSWAGGHSGCLWEGSFLASVMRPASRQVAALLEIGRKADGEIPGSLISAAYRASRSRPVMLVLHSVSPREVDQLLDPVVAGAGRDHRGVVYANLSDDAVVLDTAASADKVFASSQAFRAKLASRGIAFRDVAEAELDLGNTERPAK